MENNRVSNWAQAAVSKIWENRNGVWGNHVLYQSISPSAKSAQYKSQIFRLKWRRDTFKPAKKYRKFWGQISRMLSKAYLILKVAKHSLS